MGWCYYIAQLVSKQYCLTIEVTEKLKQSMYRPRGCQEVKAPRFLDVRHMKVVMLSALCTGHLYPAGYTPVKLLYLCVIFQVFLSEATHCHVVSKPHIIN